MQYWLPRWMLQIPYDILNRFNRHSLRQENQDLVNNILHVDYLVKDSEDGCLDHFIIATK